MTIRLLLVASMVASLAVSGADTNVFSNLPAGSAFARAATATVTEITGNIALFDSVAPTNDRAIPFGTATVGAPRNEQVTIVNVDPARDLIVNNILVAPGGTFWATNIPAFPLVLYPGEHYTFDVTYAPMGIGPHTATVTIDSNDNDEPFAAVDLSGVGRAPTGTLAGTVTLACDGTPVPDAQVTVTNAGATITTTTLSNGTYRIDLLVGTYDAFVTKSNCVTSAAGGLAIADMAVTTQDFVLTGSILTCMPTGVYEVMRLGQVVTNTVTVSNSGPLQITYQLQATNDVNPDWGLVSTNSGSAAAGDVSTFDIVFDARNVVDVGTYHGSITFSGTFVNRVPDLPLTMHILGGRVTGVVTSLVDGAPLTGVVVNATDGITNITAVTGTNGAYRLPLFTNTYIISATIPDYFPSAVSNIVVADMTNIEQNFALAIEELIVTPNATQNVLLTLGNAPVPEQIAYTVANVGAVPMTWTASADSPWLAVSPPGDTLAAGTSTNATVTLTAQANLLAPGSYTATVSFVSMLTGLVRTRQVILVVLGKDPSYDFPLDTDPGWTTEGQWAFGKPTGGGVGTLDPLSGHTGTNVYGYNLNGHYPNFMAAPLYLTTGPLDFSGLASVRLDFWRWLGVQRSLFDHASIEASTNNGVSWVNVWANHDANISDAAWNNVVCDLTGIAAGQPAVRIRWGMGPTDASVTFPGWNIDDISFRGTSMFATNMVVSPLTPLAATGRAGGPFSPSTMVYRVTNLSSNPAPWSAAATTAWVNVTPSSGALGGGEWTNVTVSIGAAVTAFAAGVYNDMVSFVSGTVTIGTRRVELTVLDFMDVLPATPQSAVLKLGEEAVPAQFTYVVTNHGAPSIAWAATATMPWLAVTPTNGILAGGAATNAVVSFTHLANTLPHGSHTGTVRFTNLSSGNFFDRQVILVVFADIVYDFPLDTDPGWTTEGQWAFGKPTGGGTFNHDPLSGHTGTNVYGYNLNGNYPNGMTATLYLTTGPLDFRGLASVRLDFWRWLGVEFFIYDHASIEASTNNGLSWVSVWANSSTISYDAWTNVVYDLTGIAAGQPAVRIRWGMGPTDWFTAFPGWNIDDISFRGTSMFETTMVVSPLTPLAATGRPGGPFTPSTMVYRVTNLSSNPAPWSATATTPWVTVTPPSGALGGGEWTNVTVSIGAAATAFAAGVYNDMVSFVSGTVTTGTRRVELTVLDVMDVLPTTAQSAVMQRGEDAVPAQFTYVVTNHGVPSIGWTAAVDMPWLAVAPTNGTLAGKAATTAVVSFTPLANTLPPGSHTGTVRFTNHDSGNVIDRQVILVVFADIVYDFPLDTDPGWTTEGQWAFGKPTGGGSIYLDPLSGHTGTNVYGYNLNGDYSNNMAATLYLTTGLLDFSAFASVRLDFWRWLGVQNSLRDHASIEASTNNGLSWVSVWANWNANFSDAAWSNVVYDITGIAAGQPAVRIRWGMGTTDSTVTYPGWNIDDISFRGTAKNMVVKPLTPFAAMGRAGGPFTSSTMVYRVTNISSNPAPWSAAATTPWVDVAPMSGSLGGGEWTNVTVSMGPAAYALATGVYNDIVSFVSGTVTCGTRQVVLDATIPLPMVDVTNAPAFVRHDGPRTVVIGGTCDPYVTEIGWSNLFTGFFGSGTRSGGAWTAAVSIQRRYTTTVNRIVVTAANGLGELAADQVDIVFGGEGTGVPVLDITNVPPALYRGQTFTILGTHNSEVKGIWWSNITANATGTATPSYSGFSVSVPLLVCSTQVVNQIMLYGTNEFGELASDTIAVNALEPPIPFLDITDTNMVWDYAVPLNLVGTNNLYVVGSMWMSNAANAAVTNFPAAPVWTSVTVAAVIDTNMAYVFGTNMIYVFGTNIFGDMTNDVITIIGVPEAGAVCGTVLVVALALRRRRAAACRR